MNCALPNGWKWTSFVEAFDDVSRLGGKVQQDDYKSYGRYPVVDQSKSDIAGYSDDDSLLFKGELPAIVFGDHTRAVKYVDFPFVRGADGTRLLKPTSEIDPEYAYYYLRSVKLKELGYSRHFKLLKEIFVPIAPLVEQRRIVDILKRADGIRRLRKQAIQTARELIPALFVDMFGDPATNPKGWAMHPIGDLVDIVSGATPSKKRLDYWSGNIPWVSPKDMKVEDISDSEDHLAESVLSETNIKVIPPASVLVVVRGMILAHTVPIRINSVPVTINQDMKALVPRRIRAAYLRWALQSKHEVLLKKVTTAGHGTRKLDTEHLVGMMIGVPPVTLQDAFEERVKAATSITGQHNGSLDYMERLFQGLLARAFRGEL